MPDVSPTKWHLAHTAWFFETFVLKKWVAGFRAVNPQYAFLFNSYYNAAGEMHRRDLRGLISRPTVDETRAYRSAIDEEIENLIASADEDVLNEIEPVLILGIHHEQQHQELLVTDIKHVLAQNPLHPVFRARPPDALAVPANSSSLTKRLSTSVTTETASLTTTRVPVIERLFFPFPSPPGRSPTANTSRSSKITATPARNSGCLSVG